MATQANAGATYAKDVSIVIPLLNEEESLPELMAWIDRVVDGQGWAAEVIFVDDGSTDGSWNTILGLEAQHTEVRGIRLQRNYGKAAGLQVGFCATRGRVVCTMDADLQDSPEELPGMYRKIMEDGYDVVSGWKKVRHDPKLSKNLPSKLFNATARRVTGIQLHDFNCGIKAYRAEVVKAIELYGDMHRYIPALAKNAGFGRIGEQVVEHRARKYGVSKFGWNRFVNGFLDLITLTFVSKFGKRPMHLFGTIGTLMFLVGGVCTLWLLGEKVVAILRHTPYRDVTDQPLFFISLLLIMMGVVFFMTGFLGDLIARSSPDRNRYGIAERKD